MLAKNTDEVVQILDTIIAKAIKDRNPIGFFPAMYRQVTLKVKVGIKNNFFDDAARMEQFTTLFANRYFAALDEFQKTGKTTRSWKVAFEALSKSELLIAQHLLLGINAHINLDLGIVAVQISPGNKLATLKNDFDKINKILGDLVDDVEAVIGKLSPLFNILDQVGGRTDEALINFSIKKARQDAWIHAQLLNNQSEPFKEMMINVIDSKVAFLGQIVVNPGRTVNKAIDLIKKTENKDVPTIINSLNAIVK
ncbi:MAG TPA: DUF5995 family protein [Nostocaceae cyanobacterium]|nr:DUF5995 family protein [Nostocaceae cyanobacterium]